MAPVVQTHDHCRGVARKILATPTALISVPNDAHTISSILPACDISIGSLKKKLPAPEAGYFV